MTGSEEAGTDTSSEGLGWKEDERLGGRLRGMLWVGVGLDAVICNPHPRFQNRGLTPQMWEGCCKMAPSCQPSLGVSSAEVSHHTGGDTPFPGVLPSCLVGGQPRDIKSQPLDTTQDSSRGPSLL